MSEKDLHSEDTSSESASEWLTSESSEEFEENES